MMNKPGELETDCTWEVSECEFFSSRTDAKDKRIGLSKAPLVPYESPSQPHTPSLALNRLNLEP